MADPGGTTPIQPVQRAGVRGPLAIGLAAVIVIGLLAWHPWMSGANRGPDVANQPGPGGASSSPGLASNDPARPVATDNLDPARFGGSTIGPWTGELTADWSVVAFVRMDLTSRDPVALRQQLVAVFVGPHDLGDRPAAICHQQGTRLRPAAANLPTREVSYLGIAFPADRTVYVDGVSLVGGLLGALPIELGRIAGDPLLPVKVPDASPEAGSLPPPGADPVRMFVLPGGGPWPDGVYLFEAYTRDGLPIELFACIGF